MFITPGSRSKGGGGFPPGTAMLFWQASAPLGWTKITTQNDKLLRVVSGAGGVGGGGGSNAFSSVNAQTVVGSSTLSSAQLAAHTHTMSAYESAGSGPSSGGSANPLLLAGQGVYAAPATDSAGSGSSHNHTISFSILYIDLILASKN